MKPRNVQFTVSNVNRIPNSRIRPQLIHGTLSGQQTLPLFPRSDCDSLLESTYETLLPIEFIDRVADIRAMRAS